MEQLERFNENMNMLSNVTVEITRQFEEITEGLETILDGVELAKSRKEEISLMADVLEEKLKVFAPPAINSDSASTNDAIPQLNNEEST